MGHPSSGGAKEQAEEAARWADRYARSRTVGVFLSLAINVFICLSLAYLWRRAGQASRGGERQVFWGCLAALVPLHVAVVWLAVPKWGPSWIVRVAGSFYGDEGYVVPRLAMAPQKARRWGIVVALLFGAGVLLSVLLAGEGWVPLDMLQPVSVLYLVPFTVFLSLTTRSYFMLVFPALYTLHAILILTGKVSQFHDDVLGLNLLLPIAGYMAFAALVGHVYNRIALSRVRRLAQTGSGTEQP